MHAPPTPPHHHPMSLSGRVAEASWFERKVCPHRRRRDGWLVDLHDKDPLLFFFNRSSVEATQLNAL